MDLTDEEKESLLQVAKEMGTAAALAGRKSRLPPEACVLYCCAFLIDAIDDSPRKTTAGDVMIALIEVLGDMECDISKITRIPLGKEGTEA